MSVITYLSRDHEKLENTEGTTAQGWLSLYYVVWLCRVNANVYLMTCVHAMTSECGPGQVGKCGRMT